MKQKCKKQNRLENYHDCNVYLKKIEFKLELDVFNKKTQEGITDTMSLSVNPKRFNISLNIERKKLSNLVENMGTKFANIFYQELKMQNENFK